MLKKICPVERRLIDVLVSAKLCFAYASSAALFLHSQIEIC